MFTGLVQQIGTIRAIARYGDGMRVSIESNLQPIMGASVCCAGCCLTVTKIENNRFDVDVSAETLSKTNLGAWQEGDQINLEPSLHLGDEMGGHFVFGHVDGTAEIINIEPEGESHCITVKVPEELRAYIAPKGSVSLDGVSLTVNNVEKDRFTVNIIPHTWQATTLSGLDSGDKMNIEIDMLARYVASQMEQQAA